MIRALLVGPRGRHPRARRLFHALFGLTVGAQLGYGTLPGRRSAEATRAVVGLLLATSAAEAVAARGPRRAAALVGGAGGAGFALELVGVATGRPFGHYHYTPLLGPQVGKVPVLAAAAWALLARPAWVVAGLVDRRPALRVPLAAGALTAWDVFLDPRMVREGYWAWPGGGRYEGVPATNFAGWFLTGLLVFALAAAVDPGDEPEVDGDGALALYVWTLTGEAVANAVLWRRPRVAAAGTLAMGAFAVPALAARLRAS